MQSDSSLKMGNVPLPTLIVKIMLILHAHNAKIDIISKTDSVSSTNEDVYTANQEYAPAVVNTL